LTGDEARLYVPREPELWPSNQTIRAGVSAMGFGGINSHIAIEQAPDRERSDEVSREVISLVKSRQDTDLLLLDADSVDALRGGVADLVTVTPKLSFAEIGDVASALSQQLSGKPVRAAIVANGPDEATRKLNRLLEVIDAGQTSAFIANDGIFLDNRTSAPR